MKTDSYKAWVASLPAALTGDGVWKIKAYRLALFLAEIGWYDVTQLSQDPRTRAIAGRLAEALGAVGAHLAAGHARRSQRERVPSYEQAAGAARACRAWYQTARHVLGEEVAAHRIGLLGHVVRLVEAMVVPPRSPGLRDREESYQIEWIYAQPEHQADVEELNGLLEAAPHIAAS